MAVRLTADDWLRAGLSSLARLGHASLKAEPLAKSLGVSRGSFYWHFADLDAFHEALGERWLTLVVDAVISEVEASARGDARLPYLLRVAFTADARLEANMRTWAANHAAARVRVEVVDRRRLAYLRGLFAEAGFDDADAEARAHLVYWTFLGHMLSGQRTTLDQRKAVVAVLAALGQPPSSADAAP